MSNILKYIVLRRDGIYDGYIGEYVNKDSLGNIEVYEIEKDYAEAFESFCDYKDVTAVEVVEEKTILHGVEFGKAWELEKAKLAKQIEAKKQKEREAAEKKRLREIEKARKLLKETGELK